MLKSKSPLLHIVLNLLFVAALPSTKHYAVPERWCEASLEGETENLVGTCASKNHCDEYISLPAAVIDGKRPCGKYSILILPASYTQMEYQQVRPDSLLEICCIKRLCDFTDIITHDPTHTIHGNSNNYCSNSAALLHSAPGSYETKEGAVFPIVPYGLG